MVDIVLEAFLTRLDAEGQGFGCSGGDQPGFVGFVVAAANADKGIGTQRADIEEEAVVRLVVHQHIRTTTRRAAVNLSRTRIFIAPGPEDVL